MPPHTDGWADSAARTASVCGESLDRAPMVKLYIGRENVSSGSSAVELDHAADDGARGLIVVPLLHLVERVLLGDELVDLEGRPFS